MYFSRKLSVYLNEWKARSSRKPLIIRGARQVGKSTLIKEFGKSYKQYVSVNLEFSEYRKVFDTLEDVGRIADTLFLMKGGTRKSTNTLLFIDEIQESPRAIAMLRYFYEELPELHVIAAGSLLEFALGDVPSFPVGRIEQVVLHPLDFSEFLAAVGREDILAVFNQVPVPDHVHSVILKQFHDFAITGGMPEVVKQFVPNKSFTNLPIVFQGIWANYRKDVEKYARNREERNVIRYIMGALPAETDRIRFAKFTQNRYAAKTVAEAFEALDLARVVQLVYPTTRLTAPAIGDPGRRPRAQFLDTGLLIYALGVQADMLLLENLDGFLQGRIVQHLVAQELAAQFILDIFYKPVFWVREKSNSNAEVDLVYQKGVRLIPIEVKAGKQGRLRSLHQFIDRCDHHYAVRLLNNQFSVEEATTPAGKPYKLMNLPYYLGCRIPQYVDWFLKNH